MFRAKYIYRGVVYLLVLSFWFLSLGLVTAQANRHQISTVRVAQDPLPPPPDDLAPEDLPSQEAISYPAVQQPANTLAMIGGSWIPQGPGPAYNGQVENIPNREVVGAIHTVAAHPTDADILYAGGVNGGVWKTTDATAVSPHWMPLTDDKLSLSIGALEFDPIDVMHNTLVAGLGRYSSFAQIGGPRTGILHTIDGGLNWIESNGGGMLTGKNISGVAPRGNIVTVSVNVADNFTCGNIGLFRSTDTGMNFVKVGPPGVAFDLAGDPTTIADLYAGLTYVSVCTGASLPNGIYKSGDTGATWTKVSNAAMDALIVDGTTNNIEIAAHAGSVFVNIIQNGQTAGIFYSGNGGGTWVQMDLPLLPAGTLGVVSSVTPGTPIVIATSAAHNLSTGHEVQIANVGGTTGANGIHTITVVNATSFSLDGSSDTTPYTSGGNWQKLAGMNPREKPGSQGGIHASIRVDPALPTTVYVGGDRQDWPFPNYIGALDYSGNLFRGNVTLPPTGISPSPQWDHLTHLNTIPTIPGGGTASSSSPHADSREMVFDANGDLIEVDDGGIYRRIMPQTNTGDWISINGDMQVTEMHDVAYDGVSDTIISGNQDTGTTYQTTSGGLIWDSLSTADGGDVVVDELVLAGSNQSVRYSSYQNLGAFRRSVWNAVGGYVSHAYPSLTVVGGGAALVPHFSTPLATNAVAGGRLLIGASNSLYESLDNGATITEIGPGLVSNSSITGGHMLVYGGMQTGVPNPDVFYLATAANVAVRTSLPGGIAVTVVPGASTVRGVAMDPADWSIAYAADSNQVFQTLNAGVTWIDITGSLAVTNIRSVEAAPGMVFVGAETGVYMYDMSTGLWSQFGVGLPNTPVWDLDYHDTDEVLVAGTLGRGAWKTSLAASIAVNKTANMTAAAVGDTIIYTYDITNTGAVALSGVAAIDDQLGSVPLSITNLVPGQSTSGVLPYVVTGGDLPGPLVNTVNVTGLPPTGAAVTADDSFSVVLPGSPAININKIASASSVSVGETITYTYQITNTGDVPLNSITAVDDRLGAVTLSAASLSPGDSTSGMLTYLVVTGDLPGPIVNTVEITGTSHTGAEVMAQDSASVTLTDGASIALHKVANTDLAAVGDTITYTYVVTNTGNIALSSITVVDDKLGAVTLGTTVLAPGASTSGILTYVVDTADLPGPILNTALATGTPPTGADVTAQSTEEVAVYTPYQIYLPLSIR